LKKLHDVESLIPRHLDDADLIALLDGELVPPSQDQAREHLESCWNCRTRLNSVQDSIQNFLRVRQELLPDDFPPSGPFLQQFRQRLTDHRQKAASESWKFTEGIRALRNHFLNAAFVLKRHRKMLLALAMACVILVVTFAELFSSTLSAKTILMRASACELVRVRLASDVVRSRVRLERIDLSTEKETPLGEIGRVQDCRTPLVSIAVQSPLGEVQEKTLDALDADLEGFYAFPFPGVFEDSLGKYFATQEWFPDVSISGYQSLIAGRGTDEDFAIRQGDLIELRHPFAPGHPSGITEVQLFLDVATNTPQQICIFASDGAQRWEYRLTRDSLEFVPRSAELAQFFSRPATKTGSLQEMQSVHNGFPESKSSRGPAPLSYFESKATDAEVSVAVALHQVDACLGEEVNIFPMSDGSILVQGLVDWPNRQAVIQQALSALAHPPQVKVYTPMDLKADAQLYDPPDQLRGTESAFLHQQGPIVMPSGLSGGEMPLYDRLFEYYSKRAKASGLRLTPEDIQKNVAWFSNQVITLSRQALFHAWAVKKLEIEFSPDRVSQLSTAALHQVEMIRQDHLRHVSTISRRLTTQLGQVVPEVYGSSSQSKVGGDSENLFQLVNRQYDLTRQLFTTSEEEPNTATRDLSRLMALLQQMR
jgi:hypothetical protein